MLEHQIGRIAAIIIGGIAGWLAEQFMKLAKWVRLRLHWLRPTSRESESAAGTNHRSRQPDYAVYSVVFTVPSH